MDKYERKKMLNRCRVKNFREKLNKEKKIKNDHLSNEVENNDFTCFENNEDKQLHVEDESYEYPILARQLQLTADSFDCFLSEEINVENDSKTSDSTDVNNHNGVDENNTANNILHKFETDSSEEYYSMDDDIIDNSSFHEDDIEEQLPKEESATDEIKKWALDIQIRHIHLDKLLRIMKKHFIPDLPLSSKTFLNTDTVAYTINQLTNEDGSTAEFVYLSISKGLQYCVNPSNHNNSQIEILINIDGLPLYQSSTKNFWPILCKVHLIPDIYVPFPVAIYSGDSKPKDVNFFLRDFVIEINDLLENGIVIDNQHFRVILKCFISDTPARSFLKCSKGHGGYYSCERCVCSGEIFKTKRGKKIIFPNIAELRTDDNFRQKKQKGHHVGTTPLLQIRPKIDMINQFSLDFMHLMCLGVMKKLINEWLHGSSSTRLGPNGKKILSKKMECLSSQIPCEFNRKPRTTNIFQRWKATEFRLFLLYIGPIVLKGIILEKFYRHFLIIHVACRILCSSETAITLNTTAKFLLTMFFFNVKKLYTKSICTNNMHNILHISDDAVNMNCNLNYISAFSFENYLGMIKRLLRSGNKPLSQICRRLFEHHMINISKPVVQKNIHILKRDRHNKTRIMKIKYFGSTLTTKKPDNTVLLKNGKCFFIEEIISNEELKCINISGKIWKQKESLYNFPCKSEIMKTWILHNKPSKNTIQVALTLVECKLMTLNLCDGSISKVYTIPLLH